MTPEVLRVWDGDGRGPRDGLGRPLKDLRISVTDRCNFRCPYCMPGEIFGRDYAFLRRPEVLTFEEILRLVRVAARLGVTKIRLTGGEPLLRRQIERLVAMIARVDGVESALTTNGALLAEKAPALREAGLGRITVSLDSLDESVFQAMNGVGFPLQGVLTGIAAAGEAGFNPIKLNAVVKRGLNDRGLLDLARFGREHGHIVRYIEFMDVGTTNGWRLDDVVPAAEILEVVDAQFPLEPLGPQYGGEVAQRYRYRDGGGEIGLIASVSQPFCGACTRARLTADGKLFTCLFATTGHDLRAILRTSEDDDQLIAVLGRVWRERTDRYSEERSSNTSPGKRIEMSYVGG
jgi:cyclic pyranopterin phosphate synthase